MHSIWRVIFYKALQYQRAEHPEVQNNLGSASDEVGRICESVAQSYKRRTL